MLLFFMFVVNVTYMKRWGLRASSLSVVVKADAGQNISNNHLNPNVLYMMLGAGIYISADNSKSFFNPSGYSFVLIQS
jgi:hypothetical protein